MAGRGGGVEARKATVRLGVSIAHEYGCSNRKRSDDSSHAHPVERSDSSAEQRRTLAHKSIAVCGPRSQSRIPGVATYPHARTKLSRAGGFWLAVINLTEIRFSRPACKPSLSKLR